MLHPLSATDIYPGVNLDHLSFETTADLKDPDSLPGQERAIRALLFGVQMRGPGYNVFAMGDPQTSRREIIESHLSLEANNRLVPSDWCYVHRFGDSDSPRALKLVAAQGRRLKADMHQFTLELRATLPGVFQQEEFRTRALSLNQDFERQQREIFDALQQQATPLGLTLLQTPNGFAFAPVRDGKVIDNEVFQALAEDERKKISENIERLSQELAERMQALPIRQQALVRAHRNLAQEFTNHVVSGLLAPLRRRYQTYSEILAYFDEVAKDIVEQAPTVVALEHEELAQPPTAAQARERFFMRYSVNLFVDHTDNTGAPVVYESNPTVENLVGRIEHRAEMGSLLSDFTLLRPGALHRANGGYLIIDAERLLTRPMAWETLKRALFDRQIRIESAVQMFAFGNAGALDPDPIPLDLKVILLGSHESYHLLAAYDPDFLQLFKVASDFAERIARSDESISKFAAFVAAQARQQRLRPLHRAAVARIIDHGIRLAGDRERLTALSHRTIDLMREADHIASQQKSSVVQIDHVNQAIVEQIERLDRIRDELHDRIHEGTVLIDVSGQAVGQINGLTVMTIGQLSFGQPARITASARLGRGELIDIERQAKLGGNLHSKAVMIVGAFIGTRFGQHHPLTFNASLVFEQNYGGIEGDSASVAEVCALLSALGNIPLRQDLAVTGSMNQHGRVQAIGGANEKIEGFFDVCKQRGLTRNQGVLLPKDNVRHLMLREDVVEAVRRGDFHLYAIETIDDALAMFSGMVAGAPDAQGQFPGGSFNGRVAQRLLDLWQRSRTLMRSAESKEGATDDE